MRSTFEGERIYLRAVEPEDLSMMYTLENDPTMWDISSFTVPYSKYQFKQYIENNTADLFADKQLRLMIIEKASGAPIGTVDITDFVPLHHRAGVGIALLKSHRGRGLAKEALNIVCNYTSNYLHFKQLYAYVAVDNVESLALFHSCGFVQTGLLKDWLCTNTGYKDTAFLQRVFP